MTERITLLCSKLKLITDDIDTLLTIVTRAAWSKLGINPLTDPSSAGRVSRSSLTAVAETIPHACKLLCGERGENCNPGAVKDMLTERAIAILVTYYSTSE